MSGPSSWSSLLLWSSSRSEMYEAIVTLHILSGMAWVGGLIVFLWGSYSLRAELGDAETIEIGDRLAKATTFLIATPFLVIGTGITQVLMSEQHDWSHLWIIVALVLVLFAFAVGSTNDAMFKKAQKKAEEAGEVPTRAFDVSLRLLWVELAMMVAIVALMVFKPV